MGEDKATFYLVGNFKIFSKSGLDLTPRGQKSIGLLALLATSKHLERNRTWLCDKLWSESDTEKAGFSLRQALREIKKSFGDNWEDLIEATRYTIRLKQENIAIDIHALEPGVESKLSPSAGEFLEGLDVRDQEFESWLTEQRAHIFDKFAKQSKVDNGQPTAKSRQSHPSVAVMPIINRTSTSLETFLSDGLVTELAEQLSKIKWLSTISVNSSFAAIRNTNSPESFGQTLGTDYVIICSLIEGGERLELFTELLEANAAKIIWCSTFGLPQSISQTDLSRVAQIIAGNLYNRVENTEVVNSMQVEKGKEKYFDLIWRGRWHLNRLNIADSLLAEECFLHARSINPTSSEAVLQLAWARLWRLWVTRGSSEDIESIRRLSQNAIRLDSSDGRSFWIAGTAEAWLKNFNTAQAYIAEALDLTPSLAIAHAQYATNFILSGQPDKAFEPISRAISLSPQDSQLFFFLGERAMAHYLVGDYEDAVKYSTKATLRRPKYWYANLIKIAALLELSDEDGARISMRELAVLSPELSEVDLAWLPFERAEIVQNFQNILDRVQLDNGSKTH